jgi:apolipoprotein D and lipocalin family protein
MKVSWFLASSALAVLSAAAPVRAQQLQAVESVDLQRYAGVWYEIASLPQTFQIGCKCTSAAYSLRADGSVGVVNSCERLGFTTSVSGTATIVDAATNARLAVDFGRGDPGSYVVVGLDPDYRWAVVSSDDERALWILSRERTLAPALLGDAIEAAARQVDLTGLRFTDQTSCSAGTH